MILGRAPLRPPTIPERVSDAIVAARSAPPATPDDPAQVREDIFRRYGVPYPFPWRHGGLNE